MKILKIFGVVVAIHAFAFVLIFANPGCSSTNKPAPLATAPVAEPDHSPSVSVSAPAGDVPVIAASPSAAPMGGFDPNAPAIAPTSRYSPTRPGTAAAAAVQVQPVADVMPATTYAVASGDSLWTVSKKNHLTVAELAAANNLPADARLKIGQKLIIPAKSAGTVAAVAEGDGSSVYKVKAGDNLAVIARRAGSTAAALKELNGLKSDTVRVGQDLKLPAGTVMGKGPVDAPAPATGKPAGDSVTHVVKAGETLGAIAQKYQVKLSDIALANNITDPGKIRPGMTLVIPGWKAPKSAQPAEQPASASAPVVLTPDQAPEPGPKEMTPADIPVIKIQESPSGPPAQP